jgi:hypothetical protein
VVLEKTACPKRKSGQSTESAQRQAFWRRVLCLWHGLPLVEGQVPCMKENVHRKRGGAGSGLLILGEKFPSLYHRGQGFWADSSTVEQVPFKHLVGGSNPSLPNFFFCARLSEGLPFGPRSAVGICLLPTSHPSCQEALPTPPGGQNLTRSGSASFR